MEIWDKCPQQKGRQNSKGGTLRSRIGPEKGSASRERSSLGLEERGSSILPQEDVEGIPS